MTETAVARPTRPQGLRTRQLILEAAVECLVEVGYSGTTTLAVQKRAGISRGSLLHQFPSRDELLVAAVRHLAAARFADLLAQAERGAGRQHRLDAAVEALWDHHQGPLFLASTELLVAARTHLELQEYLEAAEREISKRFRAGLAELFGPYSDHPRFHAVYDLLVTSMQGVALTQVFDHSGRRRAAYLRQWKQIAHDELGAAE